MDIRQTPQWGKYLSSIGWTVEKIGKSQVFIRTIPLFNCSIIKIQHPYNPLDILDIDNLAKKYQALFVIVEPVSLKFQEDYLLNNGFKKSKLSLTHTTTIYLDLEQSEDKLFSSFSENARRNIKKAQNNNLVVKVVFLKQEQDDKQFKKFYALLKNLTKLKGFFVPGYDEFHKKYLAFKDSSVLLFAFTKADLKNPLAAVWLGLLKDTSIYMNTGITKTGYETLANYLLVWEALKLSKKLGFKTFDFEGIYDPRFPKERKSWIKFSEFKERFHGEVIEYPAPLIKYYNKIYQIIDQCSQIFSR